MKNNRLSHSKLYALCNRYQWFTAGDTKQYEKMFWKNDNGATLEEIAFIIWLCSTNATEAEILKIITEEQDL